MRDQGRTITDKWACDGTWGRNQSLVFQYINTAEGLNFVKKGGVKSLKLQRPQVGLSIAKPNSELAGWSVYPGGKVLSVGLNVGLHDFSPTYRLTTLSYSPAFWDPGGLRIRTALDPGFRRDDVVKGDEAGSFLPKNLL